MAKLLGTVNQVPETSRDGDWKRELRDNWTKNPGTIFEYGDVSSSTASNLRRDYGVDAQSVTVDGELRLYVVYDPAKVDEIKGSYGKRTRAKSNGGNTSSTPAKAPASK